MRTFILLAALTSACGAVPTVPSAQQLKAASTTNLAVYVVQTPGGAYIPPPVSVTLVGIGTQQAIGPHTETVFIIPSTWTTVELVVKQPGYKPYDHVQTVPKRGNGQDIWIALEAL